MPKETFWNSATAVEGDGVSEPVLTVTWGDEDTPGVHLNGIYFDDSGIQRLSKTLSRASGKDRTVRVELVAQVSGYVEGMERAVTATRQLTEAANDLRAAGISPVEIPDALRTVLKLSTDSGSVETVVCCDVCDKPTIRIPGEFSYDDPQGEIAARCGEHTA